MTRLDDTATQGRKAPVLIDFQNDFLVDGGRMPVARNQVAGVLAAATAAIAAARGRGDPIVAIGNEFRTSDRLGNLFRRNASMAGSWGAGWDERLPLNGVQYFPKWGGDAFGNPELEPWLRARDVHELVLAVLFAKACVTATATGALARGFAVGVLAAGVACGGDRSRDQALARLSRRGVTVLRSEPAFAG